MFNIETIEKYCYIYDLKEVIVEILFLNGYSKFCNLTDLKVLKNDNNVMLFNDINTNTYNNNSDVKIDILILDLTTSYTNSNNNNNNNNNRNEKMFMEYVKGKISKYKPFLGIINKGNLKSVLGLQSLILQYYLEFADDYYYSPSNYFIENRVIFSFWTEQNPLSANRLKSIENIKKITGGNHRLIKCDDIPNFIMDKHPLHEGYKFLSAVHKADYLRTYFMHFYGGGYTDIKSFTRRWVPAFNDLLLNQDKLINGYQECANGVAHNHKYMSLHTELIGNGAYICKPNSVITKEWYSRMISLMDVKLSLLILNPAKNARDFYSKKLGNGGGYPIEWNELLGRIFHSVLSNNNNTRYVLQTVPKCICKMYM